jgi:hypothetical protein
LKWKIATGKLERYKTLGTDHIPAEVIKAGCETLHSEIHKLICSTWNKKELPQQWKEEGISIIVQIYKKVDKTVVTIKESLSYQLPIKFYPTFFLARLTPYVNEVTGDHQCGFCHNRSTTDQIFYICQILEKKWEYNVMVHQLFIDFKKAYDSIKREVLYNILLGYGIPKKPVRLIKACLNETHSKIHVGKHLADTFPTQNSLLREMLYLHCSSILP